MRPLRVLLVNYSLDVGGAELQSLYLAEGLVQRGINVEIWAGEGGPLAAECKAMGIPWRVAPLALPRHRWGRTVSMARLANALRRAGPDAIIPFTDIPNILCCSVWRLARLRWCAWNERSVGAPSPESRLVRWAVRHAAAVVANSHHGGARIASEFALDPGSVSVIPNGVPQSSSETSYEEARARLGIGMDTFVACMVANLVALKDHATLLRAWRIVLDRTSHQRLSLLLVGRFDEEATRLKALALDLGLQGSVVFLGYRPDRDWVLRAADLYVHSALFEGCPNAVLEAMEAALPVVGTAIAGIDEVIGPAGRRFLVPPSQPEALANKIASLVDDQDSRREAGAENRRRVRREFSLEGMRQRWIDLLIGGRVLDVPGGSSAVH